jgi:hypothetical protein
MKKTLLTRGLITGIVTGFIVGSFSLSLIAYAVPITPVTGGGTGTSTIGNGYLLIGNSSGTYNQIPSSTLRGGAGSGATVFGIRQGNGAPASDTAATAANISAVLNSAIPHTAIVSAGDSRVEDGNTLLAGQGLISQLMLQPNFANAAYFHSGGVGGASCAGMTSEYDSNVQPWRPGGPSAPLATHTLAFIEVGINDILGGSTASSIQPCLQAYLSQMVSDGITPIILSTYYSSLETPAQELQRVAWNAYLSSLPYTFINNDQIAGQEDFSAYYGAAHAQQPVTGVAISNGIATIQYTDTAGTISTGQLIWFSGLTSAPCLNGITSPASPNGVPVLTSTATSFTVATACANVPSTSETGNAEWIIPDRTHFGPEAYKLQADLINNLYPFGQNAVPTQNFDTITQPLQQPTYTVAQLPYYGAFPNINLPVGTQAVVTDSSNNSSVPSVCTGGGTGYPVIAVLSSSGQWICPVTAGSGGSVGPGTSTEISFFNSPTTITGSSNLTFNSTTDILTMSNPNTPEGTGSALSLYEGTDTMNTSVNASYITSTNGSRRLFFGTVSDPFYALNFSNVTTFENTPTFILNKGSSVQWQSAFNAITTVDNPSYASGISNAMVFQTYDGANSGDFIFRGANSGNTWMTIKGQNGDVGIGTSNPTHTLEASGTFMATQTSTFSGNVVVRSGTTSTIQLGASGSIGHLCFWNGSNFTIQSFSSGSITPTYTTSTLCQ